MSTTKDKLSETRNESRQKQNKKINAITIYKNVQNYKVHLPTCTLWYQNFK